MVSVSSFGWINPKVALGGHRARVRVDGARPRTILLKPIRFNGAGRFGPGKSRLVRLHFPAIIYAQSTTRQNAKLHLGAIRSWRGRDTVVYHLRVPNGNSPVCMGDAAIRNSRGRVVGAGVRDPVEAYWNSTFGCDDFFYDYKFIASLEKMDSDEQVRSLIGSKESAMTLRQLLNRTIGG